MIDITINYIDEFQITGRGEVVVGKFDYSKGLTPELLHFFREHEIPVNIHGKGMCLIRGIEIPIIQNGRNYGLLIRKIEDANTKSNEIDTLLSELENLDGDEVLDRAMKIRNK